MQGRWYHPPPPMSDSPTYDLVLLLDPAAEDETREKIVTDARSAIDADGTLLGHQPWGLRPLAYQIEHRTQAEYHLLQFNGPPSLIASLEHTLRITDGVVRHRVIKQPRGGLAAPAVAPPVATAPPVTSAAAARRPRAPAARPSPADRPPRAPEPAASAPPVASAPPETLPARRERRAGAQRSRGARSTTGRGLISAQRARPRCRADRTPVYSRSIREQRAQGAVPWPHRTSTSSSSPGT